MNSHKSFVLLNISLLKVIISSHSYFCVKQKLYKSYAKKDQSSYNLDMKNNVKRKLYYVSARLSCHYIFEHDAKFVFKKGVHTSVVDVITMPRLMYFPSRYTFTLDVCSAKFKFRNVYYTCRTIKRSKLEKKAEAKAATSNERIVRMNHFLPRSCSLSFSSKNSFVRFSEKKN